MKLSDVMGAMDLAAYAEIGLILFLVAFVLVAISLYRNAERDVWERARHMPLSLDDERDTCRQSTTRGAR